ncbi:unnamed protein product [Adineta steineri]|uniref:Uncharacterized protein n=1 Tax=Adineta steineri TaxID=433720 RepID=A0A813Z300_9BILA|nr:unnamed protein product [Adineta steineri]
MYLLTQTSYLPECVTYIDERWRSAGQVGKLENYGYGYLLSQMANTPSVVSRLDHSGFVEYLIDQLWSELEYVADDLTTVFPRRFPSEPISRYALKPLLSLLSLVSPFSATYELLSADENELLTPHNADENPKPCTLTGLLERISFISDDNEIQKLLGYEHTHTTGLRLLSVMQSDLDVQLILETKFNYIEKLRQAQGEMESGGNIILDQLTIARNHVLVNAELLGLISTRLSKRIHHNKYVLVFPATTIDHRHMNPTEINIRSLGHHREYGPEYIGTTIIHKEYYEKLRLSFDLSRRYRHKVPYCYPILANMDENELNYDVGNEININRRGSTGTSSLGTSQPSSSPRFFSLKKQVFSEPAMPHMNPNTNDNQRALLLLNMKNKNLFNHVSEELRQLHPSWEQGRVNELAFEYVQATQTQCDYLIKLFTHLARYQTQTLIDDDHESSSEKYKTLLIVIEKLYLAMVELGFSPTDELQRTLIEVSFRVMPFDRFIAAIDHNILTLTEDFVLRVISELDNDPKSYTIKEQLILMLPNTNSDLHSRLFSLIKNDRAKRTTAQLLVARSFSTDNRNRSITTYYSSALTNDIDEMMNFNNNQNGTNTHSRLIEQAAVTFFRDCCQRGKSID